MSSRSGGRRRGGASAVPEGYVLRVGLRLEDALSRVQTGDALVVDVLDMDRATARRIVASGAAAVLNAATSYSGRFPVTGPRLLVEAGIVLVDGLGSSASVLRDGERAELRGGDVVQHGQVVLSGRRRFLSDLAEDSAAAESTGGVRVRSEALVADVVALLRSPERLRQEVPPGLEQLVAGRAAVLVCGPLASRQVAAVNGLPDRRVVAVGDVGAQACRERGLRADAVLGASLADAATGGTADGSHPGRGRRRQVPAPEVVVGALTSDRPPVDAATAVLFAAGAAAVVVVGDEDVDDPLIGLLDRPRADAASAGLLRLDTGGRLVSLAALDALQGRSASASSVRSAAPRPGLLATRRRRTMALSAAIVGALLVGALVGIGPLSGLGPAGSARDARTRDLAAAVTSNAELGRQAAAADSFLSSVQPSFVAGELKGHRAVVVASAGIDPSVVQGLTQVLAQAGATVSGTVQLQPGFVAPNRQSTLDDLATRLAPAGSQPVTGAAGARAAAALAASIATTSGSAVGTAAAQGQGLLDALGQVGVVQVTGQPWLRSDLVVDVVPDSVPDAQAAAQARLGLAFGQAATATLVTAPSLPNSGSAVAIIATNLGPQVRVSVSDQAARAVGRIAAVTALKDGLQGRFGSYGGLGSAASSPTSTPAASTSATP